MRQGVKQRGYHHLGKQAARKCSGCGHTTWLRRRLAVTCPMCGGELVVISELRTKSYAGFASKRESWAAPTAALAAIENGGFVAPDKITRESKRA